MKIIPEFLQRILKRRQAYRAVFNQENANTQIVLNDLRRFCRGTSTPAHVDNNGRLDPNMSFILVGRQEVWNRIAQNLHLSDADIARMVEKDVGTE